MKSFISKFFSKSEAETEEPLVEEVEGVDETTDSAIQNDDSSTSETKGALPKKMVLESQERKEHLNTLRFALLLVGAIAIVEGVALSKLPSEIPIRRVYDVGHATNEKIGDISPASLLAETSYIWREFNHWKKNGEIEAEEHLYDYQYYFSESFLDAMEVEYATLKESGELNRTRVLDQIPGQLRDLERRVVQTSPTTWTVFVDMRLIEKFNGREIKNWKIRYPFMVETYEVNPEQNPFKLRIVGFKQAPFRIDL